MGSVYKRGNVWWMKIYHDGSVIRKSTGWTDENKARAHMESVEFRIKNKNLPNILLFDIETSPMEVYVWSFFQKYISPVDNLIKDWAILTFAAKWLFEDEIMSYKVKPREARNRQDKSIIKKLWNLLDAADVVVGQNSEKFDTRRANARFVSNGLGPVKPFVSVDTLKVSRRAFGFSSHKQDYLNRHFGLSRKIETTFELWDRCVRGDDADDALDEMMQYNRMDVVGLEELYIKLRPWIRGPANVSLFVDTGERRCPNCNSPDIKWAGYYYTPAGKYRSFRCKECGAIGRSRYTSMTLENRRNTILPVAR